MYRDSVVVAGFAGVLLIASYSAGQSPEKFEAASVKISPYGKVACTAAEPVGCTVFPKWGGSGFTATNISLDVLVELAYGVSDNQISGIDRLGTDRYDVTAKPQNGGSVTFERAAPMLRALLEERFKLVTHREMKDVPGYALVVAKGGPKLKSNDNVRQNMTYAGGLQASQVPLETLASMLAKPAGRPVVDKTGIEGKYDIRLSYAREGGPADSSVPSFFTAIQEQLGLRLEPTKVPFDVLVIDRCDRVPTEN
jgi:uncharacterized protein (TIGR03435 family)